MKFFHKDMEFEIPESVYEPAEDSLLLLDALRSVSSRKVLEIGCGSGFLSLCLAKSNSVTAVDINPDAVRAAKGNAKRNSLRMECFQSDLFSSVTGKFDVIVFNPPYLPQEPCEEGDASYSGGESGRDVIGKFVKSCPAHLEEEGEVFVVVSSLTGIDEVVELFSQSGLGAEVVARQKIPWEELAVIRASRARR